MKLLRDRKDIVTIVTDQLTVRRRARTPEGLAELDREWEFLVRLEETGLAPAPVSRGEDFTEQEYIRPDDPYEVDPFKLLASAIWFLSQLEAQGVKHGDLTRPNIVISNGAIVGVDWGQAVWVDEGKPSKRPESDAYHLIGAVRGYFHTHLELQLALKWLQGKLDE
jgi:RIO-like serine/threonine protein kinase